MGISWTESNERGAVIVEQDQTAHMCRLLLLYTLGKIKAWSRTQGEDLLYVKFIDMSFKVTKGKIVGSESCPHQETMCQLQSAVLTT